MAIAIGAQKLKMRRSVPKNHAPSYIKKVKSWYFRHVSVSIDFYWPLVARYSGDAIYTLQYLWSLSTTFFWSGSNWCTAKFITIQKVKAIASWPIMRCFIQFETFIVLATLS